jgi:hypothetical protein
MPTNDNDNPDVTIVTEHLRMRPGTNILEHLREDGAGGFKTLGVFDLSPLRQFFTAPRDMAPAQPDALETGLFDIWAAGTISPETKPIFLGSVRAKTFGEACDLLLKNRAHYFSQPLRLRGRGLFHSEDLARQYPVLEDIFPPDSDHTVQPDDITLKPASSACDVN